LSHGNPIAIVGSGLAGYTVAREFRKLDKETPLLVVTADDGCFYSKPMLSNALAAGKSAASLAMKTAAAMGEELGAEIITHTSVSAIDAAAHRIKAGEREFPYAKLVLALGADPIRLPLAGDGAGDVLSVNDLAGYAQLRERLVDKRRIAILGAGLIGCEFANDLLLGKQEVDVIDIALQPLGRLLPPAPAEAIRAALAQAGVRWHFGKKTTSVEKSGNAYRIAFEDGGSVEADLVLSAIGLAPRIALARAATLSVNRGIVVDGQLRSSNADIFALGDCAEVDGSVLPFVLPIMNSARVLGPVLAGKESALRYPVMPVVVKTPAMPTVVCPAPAGTKGDWKIETTAGGIVARFVDPEGRIAGFALTGTATAQRQQLLKEMAPA
jgi:rubredoxin-NAD+ reductase